MKRVWRLCGAAQAELFCFYSTSAKLKPLNPFPFFLKSPTDYRGTRHFTTIDDSSEHSTVRDLVGLFSNNLYDSRLLDREDLLRKVAILKDELVGVAKDSDKVLAILDDNLESLYRRHPDGAAFVELLDSLLSSPDLLLLVYNFTVLITFELLCRWN